MSRTRIEDDLTPAKGNGATQLPSGTDAQRPTSNRSPSIRFNTTDDAFEMYDDQWRSFAAGGVDIDFLVQAGGAGGGKTSGSGTRSGGGGAGGFRSSVDNSGGGTSAETPIVSATGDVLTITVGSGGSTNSNGSDSSISSSNSSFTTITCIGGGKGGGAGNGAPGNGGCGGGYHTTPVGSGTAGQGFDGGAGNNSGNNATYLGGGGGGTGSAGNAGGNGNGGDGTISSIISTTNASAQSVGEVSSGNVYFGGGGGGYDQIGSSSLSIGLGGGASLHGGSIARASLVNSGGAGAASDTSNTRTQCQGSSGVVILRMPASSYSGTTTGSPVVLDEGNNKVLVFKSSGSYTV